MFTQIMFSSPEFRQMLPFLPLIVAFFVIVLILKGYALWYSAQADQKWWFIALLVINTLGILEIIYLIFFKIKIDRVATSTSASSESLQKTK